MSDPINKLIGTCEILGEECKTLVKDLKTEKINELGFVNKYFELIEKMPDDARKEDTIKDLEEFIYKERI